MPQHTQSNHNKSFFYILKNKYIFIFFISVALLFIGSVLLLSKQQENVVSGEVQTIYQTDYVNGKPEISPMKIHFSKAVAKLDLLDKPIRSEKIKIFPNITGEWTWISQSILNFQPNQDWIPDTTYQITLSKDLFDSVYTIGSLNFQANAPKFKAFFTNESLYEQPGSFTKQVVATLQFSHPVQPQSVIENLKLHTASGKDYHFKMVPQENNRQFHIITDPITITTEDDFVYFSVSNVQNMYHKQLKNQITSKKIKIPNSSDVFNIQNTKTFISYNEAKDNEAEQILKINFSLGVHTSNLQKMLKLYEYKGSCDEIRNLNNQKILNHEKTKQINYTTLPLKNDVSPSHFLKYQINNSDSCLIATISKGLVSADGFVLSESYFEKMDVEALPVDAKIAFDGSLMSLKGDKRLNFVTRGIHHLKATISRIPSEKINHLISQSNGDMKDLNFYNDIFNIDNIAENFYEDIYINNKHPEKRHYSSLDLNKYLKNKKGIFYAEIVDAKSQNYYDPAKDSRLILITDLGIIAKYNDKNEATVYVSDFVKEQPVEKAKVQIISKNGSVLFTRYTDKKGMVQFPNFNDFKREKEPVAYLVTTQNDLSFMPINNHRLSLYYGQFSIGGEYNQTSEDMKAFVFTDRGIYRPNETAHFGIIVKNGDLKTPVGNKIKIEIKNDSGDIVMMKSFKVPEGGMFETTYTVPATAKLGTYYATITSGTTNGYQIIGEKSFKVAEFEPDTMKMDIKLKNFNGIGWIKSDSVTAITTLTNLYGVPAADYKIQSEIDIYSTNFKFEQYKNYVFNTSNNQNHDIQSIPPILKETYTNENGQNEINIPLDKYQSGTYSIYLTNTGFEKTGRRSVSKTINALVSPFDVLIGYKTDANLYYLSKNEKANLNLIAIDNSLNQIEQNNLTLEIWQKNHIEQLVQQPNGLYKYQTVDKNVKIKSTPLNISQNGLNYQLDTSKSGKYTLNIKKDNKTLLEIEYTVSGSENVTFALTKKAQLDVSFNQKTYNDGDVVKMQITAPYAGYGLITIEKDKVYSSKWFKTDKNTTEQSIVLPKDITGNAYINVMFVRTHNSDEIFMSPLSYTVQPVFINKEKQTLSIHLETPKIVKPSETLTIKYKASHQGKVILYGVNTGILNYANYKLPQPLNYFIPKTRLSVTTEQIMDLILPNANIFKITSATGGDASIITKHRINPFARKTDKPVVFFSPVLDIDETVRTYNYQVPENFNGQITVMAVAVNEERVGSAQTKTFVQSDFVIKPSIPFNVSPKDIFDVGLTVTNMSQSHKPLETQIELTPSNHFEIIGEIIKTITLKQNEEKTIQFKIKTKNILGSGSLTITANAEPYGSKNIAHIGVRPAMPYITDIQTGYNKGTTKLTHFVKTIYPYDAKQKIVASTSPLVVLPSLLQYLDKYPYICTEQLISKVFPQTVLLFEHPSLIQPDKVYDQVESVINILRTRQHWDGGIALYNEQEEPSVFASLYAYHFLSTAKKYDFNIPKNMLNKLNSYVRHIASQDIKTENDMIHSTYATYLLSLNGFITSNYLIHLEEELNQNPIWKNSIANIYLSASYQLLGNKQKANHLWKKYQPKHNLLTDLQYIYLTAKHFEAEFNQIKDNLVPTLVNELNKKSLDSLMASHAILAFSTYPNTHKNDKQIQFRTNSHLPVVYTDFAELDMNDANKELTVNITSKEPYYYSILQQGYPIALPTSSKADGIRIVKEIQNTKGEKITKANIGDIVTIKLTMNALNDKYLSNVAVVDLYAGCFEVIDDSLTVKNYGDTSTYLQSKELREDRAVFYLDLDKNAVEISYQAKINAKGQFTVPPASAQELYNMSISGTTPADTFEVEE